MENNYAFYLKTDLSQYTGKWVAISGNKIVSSGKELKEVISESKKKGNVKPLFTKISDNSTHIL